MPEPNHEWGIIRLYEKITDVIVRIHTNQPSICQKNIFFLSIITLSSANGKWKTWITECRKEGKIAVAPITTCSSPFVV